VRGCAGYEMDGVGLASEAPWRPLEPLFLSSFSKVVLRLAWGGEVTGAPPGLGAWIIARVLRNNIIFLNELLPFITVSL
jgi:hypothetical protein